ncbi:signal peptidase II [Streptomyces sp. NBC_01508]|uniref:signal peptidase II n=1 Tax=Streptomyces sp. NBC_01508 TaxID=2903888 RepID=UPI00386EED62
MNSNDAPEAKTAAEAAEAAGTTAVPAAPAETAHRANAPARAEADRADADRAIGTTASSDTSDTSDAVEAAGAGGTAGDGASVRAAKTATAEGGSEAGISPAPNPAPTRRLFWSAIAVALTLLLVDQATKWWAVSALGDARSIDVVGDVIRFWLVYNPGAAFSMGTGVTWIFTVFAGVAVVAIAWYAWRVLSTPWAYALGLLLGGATSHFGDRLFREPGFGRGHVVDFIDYAGFFVGNVADIGIFAGAVTIVVLSFMGIEPVQRVEPAQPGESDEPVQSAEPAQSADKSAE